MRTRQTHSHLSGPCRALSGPTHHLTDAERVPCSLATADAGSERRSRGPTGHAAELGSCPNVSGLRGSACLPTASPGQCVTPPGPLHRGTRPGQASPSRLPHSQPIGTQSHRWLMTRCPSTSSWKTSLSSSFRSRKEVISGRRGPPSSQGSIRNIRRVQKSLRGRCAGRGRTKGDRHFCRLLS